MLGPFLDDTDGKTAETGLTIANTDIKIWKHGDTSEASKNSGGATHIAAGRYYAVLDDTDTNTEGNLEINVHVAGALPVRRQFTVLPAVVFDALVLGTDNLQVDAIQLAGQAITASGGVTFPAATLASTTNITAGTITTATNVTTVNGLAAGTITAAAIATDAFDADALATDAITEIVSAVWANAARTLTAATNLTSTGAAIPITAGGLISCDVTAISTDTVAADNCELMFDGTGYAGGATKLTVNATSMGGQTITAAAPITVYAHVGTAAADSAQTGDVYALANGVNGFVAIKTDTAAVLQDTGTDGVVLANDAITSGKLAASATTEIVDGVWAKAMSELSAIPGVTASVLEALEWIFTLARNKITQDATEQALFKDDAATKLAESDTSESGGTFTRGEWRAPT